MRERAAAGRTAAPRSVVGFCGSCGAVLRDAAVAACPRCARALSAPRPRSSGTLLFHGVRRAPTPEVVARIVVDLALVAVAVAAVLLIGARAPGLWLVLVIVLVGWLAWSARSGRSPAATLLGQRSVRTADAEAPGVLRSLVPVGVVAADLRRGRDPFAAPPPPPEWTGSYAKLPVEMRPDPRRGTSRSPASPLVTPLTLALDSGQQVPLAGVAVLGRNPADLEPGIRAVAWPDMSRTLSKSHARLEWDGRVLWATDLGSTNGSAVVADGVRRALVPFERTPVPVSAVVSMGDRTLTVVPAVADRS